MKMSPRFREAIAYLKTRNQPPHLKYPLIALHVVANPEAYESEQLNVRDEVCMVREQIYNPACNKTTCL